MPVMRVQLNVQNTIIQNAKNVQKLAINVQKLVSKQLNSDLIDFKKVTGRENSPVTFLVLHNSEAQLPISGSVTNLTHKIAEIIATGVNTICSIKVLANKLPMELRVKRRTKAQRIALIIFIGIFSFMYFPFIAMTLIMSALTITETISKLRICVSLWNLPPQTIL